MKHRTENTHKTRYKAAVRLQWRDSMAQHGRLVVSCVRTLHKQYYQHTKQQAFCVRTQEVVGGGFHQHDNRANNDCGVLVHVSHWVFLLRPIR